MSKSSDADESCNDSGNEKEFCIDFWNKKATKEENSSNLVPVRKVYVTNVHAGIKHAELKEFFSKFGKVVEAYVRSGRKTYRRSQYYAFVTFEKTSSAEKAISARRSQLKLRERVLCVSAANSKHQPDITVKPKLTAKQKYLFHIDRSENLDIFEPEDDGYKLKERSCKINDLDNDCLSHIFSYFGMEEKLALESVCKRWRLVLLDQWMRVTNLDFQQLTYMDVLDDDTLGKVLQRCGLSLVKLCLPVSHNLTSDTIHVIATLCRNLEHLSAHAIRVTTSGINQFSFKCKTVKSLVLREPISIRDRDIQTLFEKLPLESFCLTQRNIDGLCFCSLPRTLKHLDLSSCHELMMPSLLAGLSRTNLCSLKLDQCSNLTKTDFEAVCSKNPYIEELSVADYFPNLTGFALDAITHLENLRKLDLHMNELVEDRLVALISISCKMLEILDVSGCGGVLSQKGVTDVGIKAIALNTNITDLSMSYLAEISDESFFALAEAGKLKQLRCIGCTGITDNGCSRLISLCLELEMLDVSGCDNISCETTNMAVQTLSLRPDAKKMHLIVGGTQVIDNQIPVPNSSLKVDLTNNCVERLRPDFSHDSLFESSENDEYEFGPHIWFTFTRASVQSSMTICWLFKGFFLTRHQSQHFRELQTRKYNDSIDEDVYPYAFDSDELNDSDLQY